MADEPIINPSRLIDFLARAVWTMQYPDRPFPRKKSKAYTVQEFGGATRLEIPDPDGWDRVPDKSRDMPDTGFTGNDPMPDRQREHKEKVAPFSDEGRAQANRPRVKDSGPAREPYVFYGETYDSDGNVIPTPPRPARPAGPGKFGK